MIPPILHFTQALHDPTHALGWSLTQWQLAIRVARRLRLLARLAAGLEAAGLTDQVPAAARQHLIAELQLSSWRTQAMRWAVERIGMALAEAPYPRVLLKGSAYLGQQLPIAMGRLPSDLDMMVPRADIDDAVARLEREGWQSLALDDYDRHYYRAWSHEVPPMHHPVHTMELDLHHNILPPLARTHVDADALLARLRPSLWPLWKVLHPVDQVLHSAAHLFLDAEPRERVRDIVDLDGLMRHFAIAEPGFWDDLPERAVALGLSEPLALAAHFTTAWFDTPVPSATRLRIEADGPARHRRAWLYPLWQTLLTPTDPDRTQSRRQALAAFVVLARYHRNRLPLRLLIPHLWHKWRHKPAAVDPAAPADAA